MSGFIIGHHYYFNFISVGKQGKKYSQDRRQEIIYRNLKLGNLPQLELLCLVKKVLLYAWKDRFWSFSH